MTASGSPPSPNSRAPETDQSPARANPEQVEQVAEERGERCPTCGQAVRIVTGDEGTSHFERAAEQEAERLRERLEALDGPHVLVLSDDRWTIEHSLDCRESGRMAECEIHQRVAAWIDDTGEPDLPKGRYVIGEGELPAALSHQPEEET